MMHLEQQTYSVHIPENLGKQCYTKEHLKFALHQQKNGDHDPEELKKYYPYP